MIEATILILFLLLVTCVVPYCVIVYLPGKRLSFIAFTIFILYTIYAFEQAKNYWNGDRFGAATVFPSLIFYSAIIGLLYKLYALAIAGKLEKEHWSWVDAIFPCLLVLLLGMNFTAGVNNICLAKQKKLSDEEVISSIIYYSKMKREKTGHDNDVLYYSLHSAGRSTFGGYRMELTYFDFNPERVGTDGEYTQVTDLLDACGKGIGDEYRMGYSRKELESMKHRYKEANF